MKKTTLLALAAGTALLAGCGAGAAETPVAPVAAPQVAPATTAPAPATATARGVAPVADPGATVDADDQSGDGRTVVVREARVTAGPGWVVIRTDDDSDGRVLGSAPVQPGQAGPVTVTLTEPVPATGDDDDLTAVLHLDDGDGVFDERTDPAVLDEDDDDGDRDDSPGDDVEDDDFDYRVD